MQPDKTSIIPTNPGVYILKGSKDKVLYVGKAKNLKNRLKAYFLHTKGLDPRKASMVALIKDFSYIITGNELEALILEASLIKQYKPRFNILLRDDKNYPYLKLTLDDEWPRIEVVRRLLRDNGLYFGPYVFSEGMWEAVAFINRTFPIRTCRYSLDKPMRPCIQHQMERCVAPCARLITRTDYMKIVEEVSLFLKGDKKNLLNNLEDGMTRLSNELKFEAAADIRDKIRNIKGVWESQRVIAPELGDVDVIGFCSNSIDAAIYVFFIRNGRLIGTKDFYLKEAGVLPHREIIGGFLEMFYTKELIPPDEILLSYRPENLTTLKAWLKVKKGHTVRLRIPKDGKRLELLRMADENAAQIFKNSGKIAENEVLTAIKERLNLPHIPHCIGAFDISNISGNEAVGAFICWADGKFAKDMYRHLKIKEVQGTNDYSMMHEAITRTLRNISVGGDNIPDLIIIDGGKGHLEIAKKALETTMVACKNGVKPMLIAIAKDPDRAFTLTGKTISLEERSPSSLLLKKIRDEVHRFAITYHKKLRDKKLMESPLEKISGIGQKKRLALLKYFGSIDAIRNATVEDISGLKGFNRKVAESLVKGLIKT